MEYLKKCMRTVWYFLQLLAAGVLMVLAGIGFALFMGICFLWKSTKWGGRS